LREGAKLAQLCCAEVFLLAVVELSSIMAPEAGLTIPIDEQTANHKAILAEGVERLKALGFSPTARLEIGDAGQKIAEVAEEIEARLVVVGHRPQGPPIPDYHESPPFGTIKARMGATHFLMKTLPRVATEMALHVLADNLTRIMNIVGV
jgi:nucleotide-binding universal stress UspA family protein